MTSHTAKARQKSAHKLSQYALDFIRSYDKQTHKFEWKGLNLPDTGGSRYAELALNGSKAVEHREVIERAHKILEHLAEFAHNANPKSSDTAVSDFIFNGDTLTLTVDRNLLDAAVKLVHVGNPLALFSPSADIATSV